SRADIRAFRSDLPPCRNPSRPSAAKGLVSDREIESLQKPLPSDRRDEDPARVALPRNPAEVEAARGERCTDGPADMRPPLGPGQAGTTENAASSTCAFEINSEITQKRLAGLGDFTAFVGKNDVRPGA